MINIGKQPRSIRQIFGSYEGSITLSGRYSRVPQMLQMLCKFIEQRRQISHELSSILARSCLHVPGRGAGHRELMVKVKTEPPCVSAKDLGVSGSTRRSSCWNATNRRIPCCSLMPCEALHSQEWWSLWVVSTGGTGCSRQ